MTLLNDLVVNELFDDISCVHINSNDGDDLDANLLRELTSDTANELANTVPDHSEEFLHGRLRA